MPMMSCLPCLLYFFFFKQKTAYEMRISDWSSDVCSSDLLKKLPEVSNMLEVMEVRLRLEPALAQLAALRATPADVAWMRSLAAKVVAADDLDGRELWDSALHRAIATVAGNALFLALFDAVDTVRQDETWRPVREALRVRRRVGEGKSV